MTGTADANHCNGIRSDRHFGILMAAGVQMQRDDDYLRQLLLDMEASPDWMHHSGGLFLGAPAEDLRHHFHMMLLADAGLLAEMKPSVFRISNAGHDFLALTRKNEAWEATKGAVRHIGGASIQMLYRAAEAIAMQKLREIGLSV